MNRFWAIQRIIILGFAVFWIIFGAYNWVIDPPIPGNPDFLSMAYDWTVALLFLLIYNVTLLVRDHDHDIKLD